MRMNSRMKTLYEATMKTTALDHLSLDYRLSSILEDGFLLAEGGVFLRRMYERKGNAERAMFPDLTGYECFVNHFHVEDYLGAKVIQAPHPSLAYGIVFAKNLMERIRAKYRGLRVRVILSVDSAGCAVRFHSVREGESWIPNNLESYQEEGIMVLDSEA